MTDLSQTAYKQVRLSRRQIEHLAVFLALQKNVTSVTIRESNESGIGASHWAVYHNHRIEHDFQENITDVSEW